MLAIKIQRAVNSSEAETRRFRLWGFERGIALKPNVVCCSGKKSKEEEAKAATELEALDKIMVELEAGRGARAAALTDDEQAALKLAGLGLLTMKPMIYAANVCEEDLGNQGANNVHVQVGSYIS